MGDVSDTVLSRWGSWASLIGLVVSVISLLYVRSIKKNIIKFRRRQRLSQLVAAIQQIPADAIPLAAASIQKLEALKRNLPAPLHTFTGRTKVIVEVRRQVDARNLHALKEALNDLASYSEDL